MELFRLLIEQPIFNLLEVIYAIVPGHDLGVAIIIFTALIRLALWPLLRKQLHHARKMRKLQPELKKIKKAAKGDRQKEARLQMEFYKEHEVKPFSTIGTLIVQIPIFIGLYQAVLKLINDPNTLQTFSYSWVNNLPWIQDIVANAADFDAKLLGVIDLTQKGLTPGGGLYFGAIALAFIAAISQYFQSKSLLMDQKDSRKLSVILKEAASGKESDQAEVTAALSKGMLYFMPFITFIFSINLPSALSLYFLTSSVVGYFQQRIILREDVEEMIAIADENGVPRDAVDAGSSDSLSKGAPVAPEAGGSLVKKNTNKKAKSKKSQQKKRRKR